MTVKSTVAVVAFSCALAACAGDSRGDQPGAQPTATITVTETVTATSTATPDPTAAAPSADVTAEPPTTVTLRGTLQLYVNRNPNNPANCTGFQEEGYGDIHIGQQVLVTGDSGQTLAAGQLTGCRFSPMDGPEQARGILFDLVVKDVAESSFVQVEVGTGQRGGPTYSWEQLEEAGWTVALNL